MGKYYVKCSNCNKNFDSKDSNAFIVDDIKLCSIPCLSYFENCAPSNTFQKSAKQNVPPIARPSTACSSRQSGTSYTDQELEELFMETGDEKRVHITPTLKQASPIIEENDNDVLNFSDLIDDSKTVESCVRPVAIINQSDDQDIMLFSPSKGIQIRQSEVSAFTEFPTKLHTENLFPIVSSSISSPASCTASEDSGFNEEEVIHVSRPCDVTCSVVMSHKESISTNVFTSQSSPINTFSSMSTVKTTPVHSTASLSPFESTLTHGNLHRFNQLNNFPNTSLYRPDDNDVVINEFIFDACLVNFDDQLEEGNIVIRSQSSELVPPEKILIVESYSNSPTADSMVLPPDTCPVSSPPKPIVEIITLQEPASQLSDDKLESNENMFESLLNELLPEEVFSPSKKGPTKQKSRSPDEEMTFVDSLTFPPHQQDQIDVIAEVNKKDMSYDDGIIEINLKLPERPFDKVTSSAQLEHLQSEMDFCESLPIKNIDNLPDPPWPQISPMLTPEPIDYSLRSPKPLDLSMRCSAENSYLTNTGTNKNKPVCSFYLVPPTAVSNTGSTSVHVEESKQNHLYENQYSVHTNIPSLPLNEQSGSNNFTKSVEVNPSYKNSCNIEEQLIVKSPLPNIKNNTIMWQPVTASSICTNDIKSSPSYLKGLFVDEELWSSPPWELSSEDGSIYHMAGEELFESEGVSSYEEMDTSENIKAYIQYTGNKKDTSENKKVHVKYTDGNIPNNTSEYDLPPFELTCLQESDNTTERTDNLLYTYNTSLNDTFEAHKKSIKHSARQTRRYKPYRRGSGIDCRRPVKNLVTYSLRKLIDTTFGHL